MIGDVTLALNIFEAGSGVGKNGCEQIVRAHALNLRWNFFSILKTEQRERAVRVPPPACGEDRRVERRLFQNRLHSCRLQKVEDISQRKTMLLSQRDVQTVVRSRGLQLEVKADAETLAQSQSPGFIDAAAERGVNYQLHSAAFVEEAFRNHSCLSWHCAQHGAALQNVFDCLLCAGIVEAAFVLQTAHSGGDIGLRWRKSYRRSVRQHLADLLPQRSYMFGKFFGACRSFAAPERDARRRSVCVLHQHAASIGFDAANHPRGIS